MDIGKSVMNEIKSGISNDLKGQFFTGVPFPSKLYTFVYFELRNAVDIIIDTVRFNK